jgi:hypothetical protein
VRRAHEIQHVRQLRRLLLMFLLLLAATAVGVLRRCYRKH